MSPPQQGKCSNPLFRRPPYSSYRKYSYGDNTPESLWQRWKPTIVVGGFIGLCCGTFLCQAIAVTRAQQGDSHLQHQMDQNLVSAEQNIEEGRPWVLLSSSFAHVNLLHLGLNMICLWSVGRGFVSWFGASHFIGIWVLSAVSCSAAGVYWRRTQERLRLETAFRGWGQKQEFSILGIPISRERAVAISGGSDGLPYRGGVGASGALCGLCGMMMSLAPTARASFFGIPGPLWAVELVFVAGSAFCMATGSIPFIGHAGHLGGTAAGMAYFFAVARPWLRRTGRL